MNYFELHLGDYAEATAHLSILEDGAYLRLMRKYYSTKQPLPGDKRAIYRLIGARSKDEREAVDTVLDEFFDLQADGLYHQARCDAEIVRFQEKQEKARKSADSRWSKNRADAMRPHTKTDANASVDNHANASESHNGRNAHQSPTTNHQSPNLKPNTGESSTTVPSAGSVTDGLTPGFIAGELRGQGVTVTSANPIVHAWIADGFTMAKILTAVQMARQYKPIPMPIPCKYLDTILRNPTNAAPISARDQSRADTVRKLTGGLASEKKGAFDAIDGKSTRVD